MGSKISNNLIEGDFSYLTHWNHLIRGNYMYTIDPEMSVYDELYHQRELNVQSKVRNLI